MVAISPLSCSGSYWICYDLQPSHGIKIQPSKHPWCGAQSFEEDHLYAWLFDKQVSPWSYLFSALALITIMLCCMFPLAPHPVKLAAVYVSMTLIICILATLTVRSLLALSSWVLLGRSLWLFPHLLSDVRPSALNSLPHACPCH